MVNKFENVNDWYIIVIFTLLIYVIIYLYIQNIDANI
jgi:hypothetical protein